MSLLAVIDGPPIWALLAHRLGMAFVKQASPDDPPKPAYNLSGMLYLAANGWLMLSVPNALVRGIFDAMDEPGIELPPGPDGKMSAHISVMKPAEIEVLGGPDKITERGKRFAYTLGRLYEVEPAGWPDMRKAWFMRVHSPELQQLRQSYGLSPLPNDGKYDFHVTVAVLRRGVLGRNENRKGEDQPAVAG